MKIDICAYISAETLIEKGEEAGLSEEAVNFLRHFGEVPLELYIDESSGEVIRFKLREEE